MREPSFTSLKLERSKPAPLQRNIVLTFSQASAVIYAERMPTLIAELTPWMWALLLLAASFVGLSKTAVPGINTLSIAIFAALLPAKPSTGLMLILLLVGDLFALWTYRKHADWRTLWRLFPSVVVGLAVGAVVLAVSGDALIRRLIGVILLIVIAFSVWQRFRPKNADAIAAPNRAAQMAYGSLGGFTTMVANAGGPVLSMYFLYARFEVKAFLGTAAWFFAIVNVTKLPVSIGLGLITPQILLLDALLIPGVIVGAFFGRWIANRIKQVVFDWIVIGSTVLGAAYLLF